MRSAQGLDEFSLNSCEPAGAHFARAHGHWTGSTAVTPRHRTAARTRLITACPEPDFIVIVYGGHEYLAKRTMGEIFLKHARRIVADSGSELVPLAHKGGVDLLFISRTKPFHTRPAVR